jgi:signal transduction histidine kinase
MHPGPTDQRTDPQWSRLLSLAGHEFSTPLGVVAGYIRMLLQDRATSDPHRRLLEPAQKSCGDLSRMLTELRELSKLESGETRFNRGTIKLRSTLADAIEAQPDLPERMVKTVLIADSDPSVNADAVKLKTAFTSILHALRRELVASDELVVQVDARDGDVGRSIRITIGEPDQIAELLRLEPQALVAFDEWRGGNGLRLPSARRIIEAHGGRLLNQVWERTETDVEPKRAKTTAIVTLPLSE